MSKEKNISLLQKHGTFNQKEIEVGRDGDISKVDTLYLESILLFRQWHKYPTLISSFYRNDEGSHGEGCASDQILFKKYLDITVGPKELFRRCTHWPFLGVGIYFDWAFTNRRTGKIQRTCGAHLDTSKLKQRPLRWFSASFNEEGEPVTPLLLSPEERKSVDRVFYYQDPSDGRFKKSGDSRGYTFNEAVKQFWTDV